jgi:uncharacterized peroxidase-related enzyme
MVMSLVAFGRAETTAFACLIKADVCRCASSSLWMEPDNVKLREHELNLPVVSEADASPEVARLYARFHKDFGRPEVPGILQCFATHSPLLEHMMGLAKSMLFTEGVLGRKTKEMLATLVSARNSCEYCADSHGYSLRMNGGSPDLLAAAMTCDLHSTSVNGAEAALLAFVRKVTDDSHSIQPGDVDGLRASGWTDQQIAEAIHVAALFACFNRVVNAFGLPSQGMLATLGETI